MDKLKQMAGVVSLVLVIGLGIWVAILARRVPSGLIVSPEKQVEEGLSEVSVLKAQIKSHREEMARLRQKLNLLTAEMEELQTVDTELKSLHESLSSTGLTTIVEEGEVLTVTNLDEPEVQEKIEGVIEEVMERKQEERDQARRQEAQRRFERWNQQRLNELTEELGLDDYQNDELKRIWDEQSRKMQELWAAIRGRRGNDQEGRMSREDIQKQFRQIRDETNQKVQEVLYPDQYEEYLKIQEESQRGRFGPFRTRRQPEPR